MTMKSLKKRRIFLKSDYTLIKLLDVSNFTFESLSIASFTP
jgi:hypothetical protein